jgi:hypothetical protein
VELLRAGPILFRPAAVARLCFHAAVWQGRVNADTPNGVLRGRPHKIGSVDLTSDRRMYRVTMNITRRAATVGLSALALTTGVCASGASEPTVTVTKDPNCDCCTGWTEHLRSAGFLVQVRGTTELGRVKVRLGVPTELAACHTAEVDGYVIEGWKCQERHRKNSLWCCSGRSREPMRALGARQNSIEPAREGCR